MTSTEPLTKGQKISAKLQGRKQTAEHIEKRVSARGRHTYTWSAARIEKMRERMRGRVGNERTRHGGYAYVYMPQHRCADSEGYVAKYRIAMEQHIGRPLRSEEVVHHRDGNRLNNALANLQLFANGGSHSKYHREQSSGVAHSLEGLAAWCGIIPEKAG